MYAQKLLQKNKILTPVYVLQRYLNEAAIRGLISKDTRFEPPPKQQLQRKSPLEALFSGHIEKSSFTFPEQGTYRYNDFCKWLKPIETYISSCTEAGKTIDKNVVLNELRELEVFRTHIDNEYFGLSLTKTESLRLIEILSNLPWLGTYMLKNHIQPIQIISKYASEAQKQKYFPKIISGEMIPSICMYEDDRGTNVNSIKSFVLRNDDNSWLLNGNKTYVINGINSNLFLVFARNLVSKAGETSPEQFSLYLVERDFGGVSCTDIYETIGRHELPTCTISFKDTLVPCENTIGNHQDAFNILMEYLKPGKQNIAGQAISILRNFTNRLIPDILKIQHFDRELYKFDLVKKILGDMMFSLYTMESMAYLTAGVIDEVYAQDAELEQIITETYCANKCLSCIQSGLQLIGAQSYLNSTAYIQAFHDAAALTTMDTNNMDAYTYTAAKILKYVGKQNADYIEKKRNFLQYPVHYVLDSLFSKQESLEINEGNYFHPSLQYGVQHMEGSVLKLKESIVTLLTRSGSSIMNQYSDLYRLSEITMEIFIMLANLSRSSRSYSIGVRNADLELELVVKMAIASYFKISVLAEEISNGEVKNGDECFKNAMDIAYGKHKYPMEHPLTRTF